jgi:hypothetical protein
MGGRYDNKEISDLFDAARFFGGAVIGNYRNPGSSKNVLAADTD